ncbi:unnamed protein product [Gemmata massiliana]|uniref:Uncharacterized protein n=1 Tax=Gemmata massiliana TaxID=1210884 RepID=A0A6P2CSG8_9BACT|nr:hypothetical protein [Gemmata massiliana]VTR91871.1 unnamed protein product [Gemmata massiliana]
MSAKNTKSADPKKARLYEAMVSMGRLVDEMERCRAEYGDLLEQSDGPDGDDVHPWLNLFNDIASQYGREEARVARKS